MRKYVAEAFGTFVLVFAGTGAIVIDGVQGGVTHVGIALTFGLAVLLMVYTIGEVSGAHINPAVTLGFAAARRFPLGSVVLYIASQCIGALLASILMLLLFGQESTHLGTNHPAGPPWQSFVLEVILTFFLMTVILSVTTGAKEKGITAGIAIGGTIALDALFAGRLTGASMNPARSLAPALVSGDLKDLWIYLLAPIVGALLAVPLCWFLQGPGGGKTQP